MTSTTFFIIFIPVLAILLLSINLVLAPHNPYQEKDCPFECGFNSFRGQNRTEFSISFFIFGLLFLLFDLEILLLYPYCVSSYHNYSYGLISYLAVNIFVGGGLVFEIAKGALVIDSKQVTLDLHEDKAPLDSFIIYTEKEDVFTLMGKTSKMGLEKLIIALAIIELSTARVIIDNFSNFSLPLYTICSVFNIFFLYYIKICLGRKVRFLTKFFLFLQILNLCILAFYSPGIYSDIIKSLDWPNMEDCLIYVTLWALNFVPLFNGLLSLFNGDTDSVRQPAIMGGPDDSGLEAKGSPYMFFSTRSSTTSDFGDLGTRGLPRDANPLSKEQSNAMTGATPDSRALTAPWEENRRHAAHVESAPTGSNQVSQGENTKTLNVFNKITKKISSISLRSTQSGPTIETTGTGSDVKKPEKPEGTFNKFKKKIFPSSSKPNSNQ